MLNETSSPVTFHISMFYKNSLILPTQSITFQTDTITTFPLQIKELPCNEKTCEQIVALVVSANSSIDDLPQFQRERISIKPYIHQNLLLQRNKREYFVGETILYRAIFYNGNTSEPLPHKRWLDICYTNNSHCNDRNEGIIEDSSSSEFVFRGIATAKEGYDWLTSNIPWQEDAKDFELIIKKPSLEMADTNKVTVQSTGNSETTYHPTPFVELISATMFPKSVDNFTPVIIKLKVGEKHEFPSQTGNEFIHCKLYFTGAGSENADSFINEVVSLKIDSEGVKPIKYAVHNLTRLEDLALNSNLTIDFLNYNITKSFRITSWNEKPKLQISLLNENERLNAGDVAQFHVYSPNIFNPIEIKFRVTLGTNEGPIWAEQKSFNLTDKPGNVLEIKIPEDLVDPTIIQMFMLGSYGNGFSKNSSNFEKHFSECEIASLYAFDVNIQKPVLQLQKITNKNATITEVALQLTGGARNITHVSLDLIKLDEFLRKVEVESAKDNSSMSKEEEIEKSGHLDKTDFYEFKFPRENNGTVNSTNFGPEHSVWKIQNQGVCNYQYCWRLHSNNYIRIECSCSENYSINFVCSKDQSLKTNFKN